MVLDKEKSIIPNPDSLTLPNTSLDESWRKFSFKNFNPQDFKKGQEIPVEWRSESKILCKKISDLDGETCDKIFETLQTRLEKDIANADLFLAQGFSDWMNGYYVEIPPHAEEALVGEISKIMDFSNPNSVDGLGQTSYSPFLYIQVGAYSKARIIDRNRYSYSDEESFQWVNPMVVVNMEDSSHFEYITEDILGESVFFFRQLFTFQNRDSYFKNFHYYGGGFRSKVRQFLSMDGEGSEVRSLGLSALAKKEFWDHETEVRHRKNHTTSSLSHKVVVKDKSHHVFTGNLHIPGHLSKVLASQVNHNLSLDPKARAESIPKLEIFSEDVQSSHGSTVGEIDDEKLFYLLSRGLNEEEAKHLLVEAFLTEIIDEISIESVKERFKESLKEILWHSEK